MQSFSHIKTIIWDWNGTLLNDAEYCVECMNKVLEKRKIKQINIDQYRTHFTFPVKDYYEAIGFDFEKEKFEIPAMEFINNYYKHLNQVSLHTCVFDILNYYTKLGYRQIVLSAMEHKNLINSLTEKGIIDFFEEIKGIDDHYAHSKLKIGKKLMLQLSIDASTTIMIGDTTHDLEVATGLGIACTLVSIGHQSEKRLLKATPNVISKLGDITKLI